MICPGCQSYQSGDYCKSCEKILFEKPSKTKTIKKRSDKGIIEDILYKAKRQKFLKSNPKCAIYPALKSSEIHHKKGRIGKNYLDESTWLAVSRTGHMKIEAFPEWAYENGYSESRLKTT